MSVAACIITACEQESMPASDDSAAIDKGTISPIVAQSEYISPTKTSESGYSTSFTNGDTLGIYAVKGGVITDSDHWSFNGTAWTEAGDGILYNTDTYYFAYYPYDASMDASILNPSATTAESFFDNYIQSFAVRTDQSSPDHFSASDLMVSTGEKQAFDNNTSDNYWPVSFSMSHQMSLIVISSSARIDEHYLSTDTDYNWYWQYSATIDVGGVYDAGDDTFRYLVNPSIEGDTYIRGQVQRQFYQPYGATSGSPENVTSFSYCINPGVSSMTRGRYYATSPFSGYITSPTATAVTLSNGDFYMTDGRIAEGGTSELYNALSDEDKGNIIGVVIVPSDYYDSSVVTDLGHNPHGIVLSMARSALGGSRSKLNIKEGMYWAVDGYTDVVDGVPNYAGTATDSLLWDVAGYQSTKIIQAITDYSTKYPAFYYASEYYQSNYYAAPSTPVSTGWFLPSPGQWAAIWKVFSPESEYPATGGDNDDEWKTLGKNGDNVIAILNDYLSVAGGGLAANYTGFGLSWLWCSAQYGSRGYNVHIKDNWMCIFGWNNEKTTPKTDGSGCVRPFLIF